MNPALKLVTRTFPARIAELGCRTQLPEDWVSHPLPDDAVDFANPTTFAALALVSAPAAAIFFTFAARPAYDDGTLTDWAHYLLGHNQLTPRAVGQDTVAGVPSIIGEATQVAELGNMIVRFAFFEDGGRLINLTLTAPELLGDAVRDAWFAALQTFQLETPRGSRFNTPTPLA